MTFALSVPANLLLLGEYLVTEEGGRGIALACAPRALLDAAQDHGGPLRIEATMGPSNFVWAEGETPPSPLVEVCVETARAAIVGEAGPTRGADPFRGWTLRIDSSAFFSSDGSKRGFGSSAAVAVALVAALLRAGGLPRPKLEETLFPIALAAHRRAQGGRGSGYDVAASRFGGVGMFVGGQAPRWESLPPPARQALVAIRFELRKGGKPVSSAAAVSAYEAWKRAHPTEHRNYRAGSSSLVARFSEASREGEVLAALGEAAELGRALGKGIGVPADPVSPARPGESSKMQGLFAGKCLGAGDELVLALASADDAGTIGDPVADCGAYPCEERAGIELAIEEEGLRWA